MTQILIEIISLALSRHAPPTVQVKVSYEDGHFIAVPVFPAGLDHYGAGDTASEAVRDLVQAMVSSYETLKAESPNLGSSLQKQYLILRSLFERPVMKRFTDTTGDSRWNRTTQHKLAVAGF